MIVVRNSFIAKPGHAGKLATLLKEMAGLMMPGKFRILTDLTGDFNSVVFEFEAENLAEFEERFRQYGTDPAVREKMAGYTDLWISGSREIYQVVK
jgi:hypothetical protein